MNAVRTRGSNGRLRVAARRISAAAACLAALGACGCGWLAGAVTTRIEVRTAARSLREQVLGAYDRLGEEVFQLAGVRAVDPLTGNVEPPPPMTDSRRAALSAGRRMEFNRDDILSLKRLGVLGETADARLAFAPGAEERLRASDPWLHRVAAALMQQENEDRGAVERRIIETTPQLQQEGGERELRAILADRYRAEAESGRNVKTGSPGEDLVGAPGRAPLLLPSGPHPSSPRGRGAGGEAGRSTVEGAANAPK
jgi:hypothetical protein